MNAPFIPVSSLQLPEAASLPGPVRLRVTSDFKPAPPPQAPPAFNPPVSTEETLHALSPKITVHKLDAHTHRIRIECACGQIIELACALDPRTEPDGTSNAPHPAR